MPPALVTIAELAAYLELEVSDLNAAKAELMLELASDLVRDELRQRVDLVEDDVVDFTGTGTAVILLTELPVLEVTSVTLIGEGSTYGTDDALDGVATSSPAWRAELGPDGRRGILRSLGGCWPHGRIIRVVYSHGYELAGSGSGGATASDVPGGIRMAVLRSAARGYINPDGVSQESVGRASISYRDAGLVLTDTDRGGLARYYAGSKGGAR
jgi:DNA-binding transcriptional ArsR family regulator